MRRNKTPYKVHFKHHLLHSLWSVLVFASGIGADVGIMDYKHSRPKSVLWQDGTRQVGFVMPKNTLPPQGTPVQLGVAEDGMIVWRVKP